MTEYLKSDKTNDNTKRWIMTMLYSYYEILVQTKQFPEFSSASMTSTYCLNYFWTIFLEPTTKTYKNKNLTKNNIDIMFNKSCNFW